jgi:hypothetical protein
MLRNQCGGEFELVFHGFVAARNIQHLCAGHEFVQTVTKQIHRESIEYKRTRFANDNMRLVYFSELRFLRLGAKSQAATGLVVVAVRRISSFVTSPLYVSRPLYSQRHWNDAFADDG